MGEQIPRGDNKEKPNKSETKPKPGIDPRKLGGTALGGAGVKNPGKK